MPACHFCRSHQLVATSGWFLTCTWSREVKKAPELLDEASLLDYVGLQDVFDVNFLSAEPNL